MTTIIDARGPSRRALLAGAVKVGLGAGALMVTGAAVMNPNEAWGLEVTNLKPETMRTLIVMARDIYPHDRIPDRNYAIAMKVYETGATDPALKALVEDGVLTLDTLAKAKYGVGYADLGWEDQRVAILRQIEDGAFFQKVRGRHGGQPLQPGGGVADLRIRGRLGRQGRLYRPRLQRHCLALRGGREHGCTLRSE